MILDELRAQLVDYTIEKITEENIGDVFEVMKSNKYFISRTQKHEVAIEECLEDINNLPPNIEMDKKTYVSVYDGEKCIALIDFIEGYPAENIGYIGLFMLEASVHKKGISKKLLNGIFDVAKKKFDFIELACHETNQIGLAFWTKMGFKIIRETERETDGEIYTIFSMKLKLD